jgi:hypothetical protein
MFFERNGMAESDNILTKLQELLVYLIPQSTTTSSSSSSACSSPSL